MSRSGPRSRVVDVVEPAVVPLSAVDARRQIRETSTVHDLRLAEYSAAAFEILESATGVRLVEQTVDVFWDHFPADEQLVVPVGPVLSLETFELRRRSDGTTVPIATTIYDVDLNPKPPFEALIYLKPEQQWPSTELYPRAAVRARLKVGYAVELAADAAEASTDTTTLKMTGHGLVDRDLVLNVTQGSELRSVRFVDLDTVSVEAIAGQTDADVVRKFQASKIPLQFMQAARLLIGDMFELTDDVMITPAGATLTALPTPARNLVRKFRLGGL